MDHLNSTKLVEYVTRSLSKGQHKKYESYVINRLIHQLDDFSLKFVTQQYVRRTDNKIALTDLFFPQLGIHIEIDEGHHFEKIKNTNIKLEYLTDTSNASPHYIVRQIDEDRIREEDIINITGHEILRINVFQNKDLSQQTLQSIHNQIDDILLIIKNKKHQLSTSKNFTPWNINTEFDPQTYINLGKIELKDNVVFERINDACNCFGHSYKGFQRGGANHPYDSDTLIWFPKLYPNDEWDNSISTDGTTIIEKSVKPSIMPSKVIEWNSGKQKRIVFAKVRDNLSNKAMYRFLGLFQLSGKATIENGGTWHRISTIVKTYPPLDK